MPIVPRIAAYLLLACWLPALLHCRLEAAGLLFASECCDTAERLPAASDGHGCADDSCEVVEGDFLAPVGISIKVPASGSSAVAAGAVLLPVALVVAPPVGGGVGETTAAPPGVRRPPALVHLGPRAPRAP